MKCPQCGSEDLDDIPQSSNFYCNVCDEVVEPIEVDDFSDQCWVCYGCGESNTDFDDACDLCGLSRDASEHMWDRE